MHYLEFLRRLHEVIKPRTYLEIGIRHGSSLALSKARTIAVDPAFSITYELGCDIKLARCTSDEFFERPDPLAHFGEDPVDLAFIDGMHLFEYALRDFMNVERSAAPTGVIVFDDMLPRNPEEAARDRTTREWTGDVWKLIPVLVADRPELTLILVDTEPTGLLLVLGLDRASTVLRQNFGSYVADLVEHESELPKEIIARTGAVSPEALLEAPFWATLRRTRDGGSGSDSVTRAVRGWLQTDLTGVAHDLDGRGDMKTQIKKIFRRT